MPPGCVGDAHARATNGVSTKCSSRSWASATGCGVLWTSTAWSDILVQARRDQHAAETFLRRVIAAAGREPRVVISDRLSSYSPALRRAVPNVHHRRHKGLNNRAKNSHQPTRQRERVMRRFNSAEHAQRFLGPFGAVGHHFRIGRFRAPAGVRRQLLVERHSAWR